MFGIGGSEIIVILIVALLFLGPEKLPQATKQISKTIRELKKQSRSLQQQIENDDQIGGALRDIKSALRGEDPVERPKIKPRKKELTAGTQTAAAEQPEMHIHGGAEPPELAADPHDGLEPPVVTADADKPAVAEPAEKHEINGAHADAAPPEKPAVTLPATAGEPDPSVVAGDDPKELAAMVKPAAGTVAKGS